MTEGTRTAPARRKLRPLARIGVAEAVTWNDNRGTSISLTVAAVRDILPHGRYPATDAEILLFLHQARSMEANPFMRDLHLIKYAPNDPAAIVTGYHFLMATAKANPAYRGYEQWFVNRDGKRIQDGLADEENVVAAICEVHMAGYDQPVRFVARKKEFNKGQAQWLKMPVVMLGKCAIANAHRLADPGLAGMYLAEEFGQSYAVSEDAGGEIIDTTAVPTPEEPAEPATAPAPAESAGSSESPEDIAKRVCPKCQKKLRLNKPREGGKQFAAFIGCTGYKRNDPDSCDYTEKWEAPAEGASEPAAADDGESTLDKIKQDAAVLWPAKEGMKEKYDQAKLGAWLNDQFGVGALGGLNEAQATEAYDRLSVMVDEKAEGEGAA